MTEEELTQLVLDTIAFSMEMHEDIPAAHRILRSLDRLRLEQLCCVLGAMVDPNGPLEDMTWWRDLPEAREAA